MRVVRLRLGFLGLATVLAAAAALAAPTDRSLTASGTVDRIQSTDRAFTVVLSDGSQARFVWSSDTRFSGVLMPGARVTIRYDVTGDGRNVAQQISVARS